MYINSIWIPYQLHQLVLFVVLGVVEPQSTTWNNAEPRASQRDTSSDSCQNPRNEAGTCMNIRRCPSMLELLKSSRQNPTAGDFLRRAACGSEGRDPKVCCTDFYSTSPPRPTTSRPNSQSTRRPTATPSTRRPNSSGTTTRYPDSGDQCTGPYCSTLGSLPGQDRCGVSKAVQANRIVGGQPADLGAWPWIAALGYKKLTSISRKPNWLCGGALVSTRHVITAAHCISARSDVELYVVRLGELDLDANVKDGASPVDILIADKIAHPGFNTSTFVNDIGILRLQKAVTFTDLIQPICIPYPQAISENTFVNYEPFIAGWGSIASNGPPSSALRQVQVPVVDNEECKNDYRNIRSAVIDDRVLCAGYASGGKDSCQGDSGGPLMLPQGLKFYLLGVVSYGKKCAEPGFPGVYTRVSSFLRWIADNAN